MFNPLNAELNPICHLLALFGAHHIFHVSGLRVKMLVILCDFFVSFVKDGKPFHWTSLCTLLLLLLLLSLLLFVISCYHFCARYLWLYTWNKPYF